LFSSPAKARDESEPDPDLRKLSIQKTNYGPMAAPITVRWTAGAYVPEGGVSSLDRMALQQKAESTFVDLLRQFNTQGQNLSANACSSSNYAPKVFAAHPKAQGIGRNHFAAAMQSLLDQQKIKIKTTGPASKQRQCLILPDFEGAEA